MDEKSRSNSSLEKILESTKMSLSTDKFSQGIAEIRKEYLNLIENINKNDDIPKEFFTIDELLKWVREKRKKHCRFWQQ